jgi:hypothetical protein
MPDALREGESSDAHPNTMELLSRLPPTQGVPEDVVSPETLAGDLLLAATTVLSAMQNHSRCPGSWTLARRPIGKGASTPFVS